MLEKREHEIRDPIHVFVRLDSDERQVVDSKPFQRLRHIQQLALTNLVYPGATHKRFEHSLGVMELASRVFDTITHPKHTTDAVRDLLPMLGRDTELQYWRKVVRMAALCHDLGHGPFSHAAEKELLPDGWSHERLSAEIIKSEEMERVWKSMAPRLESDDIVKLAIGPEKARPSEFSDWEAVLAELIVGDAFGVDRMDYLLRDSHHMGVAYGRFDHFRLIDTLRILPSPKGDKGADRPEDPRLGIEWGGLQSAEALLLARYFMFTQVYFHPVRRAYDIHLKEFLREWLPGGRLPVTLSEHLALSDIDVERALILAAEDVKAAGHDVARRIVRREHMRVLYQRNPDDLKKNPNAAKLIFEAAEKELGMDKVRHDCYIQDSEAPDFPVQENDGRIVSSLSASDVLAKLPLIVSEYVFVMPEDTDRAKAWLSDHREEILTPKRSRNGISCA